jgi:hypothetical protein
MSIDERLTDPKKTHPPRAFRLYKTFGFTHGQKHGAKI